MSEGLVAPAGELKLQKTTDVVPAPLAWRLRNYPHLLKGLWKIKIARLMRIPHFYGTLSLRKITPDGTIDYGVVGYKVVTTAGCGFIVDAFQNLVELENMKYHGFGSGGTAESSAQSALVTEYTTEYVVNSTRPTGTTTELQRPGVRDGRDVRARLRRHPGGDRARHLLSATSAGVMLDRTLFSAVNLVSSSDSLQSTYDLTFTAGS